MFVNFKKINHIKAQLGNKSVELDVLIELGSIISRVQLCDIDDLFAQFHNQAGRLPYIDDEDVGAVILQFTAFETDDIGLKKRFFEEAIRRASWCAQGASSGGEGESRKRHLFELVNQLKKYQGCSTCNIHDGKFESESDYILVDEKISKLVMDNKLKKISDGSTKNFFFKEVYQCVLCHQIWVLSHPDQAYRGGWVAKENGS